MNYVLAYGSEDQESHQRYPLLMPRLTIFSHHCLTRGRHATSDISKTDFTRLELAVRTQHDDSFLELRIRLDCGYFVLKDIAYPRTDWSRQPTAPLLG
jgi:hypothetical protein